MKETDRKVEKKGEGRGTRSRRGEVDKGKRRGWVC